MNTHYCVEDFDVPASMQQVPAQVLEKVMHNLALHETQQGNPMSAANAMEICVGMGRAGYVDGQAYVADEYIAKFG